jgi:3-oxoacyl-[acyl-carrier protein] reductase
MSHVLVTGGSRGLGREIGEVLAEAGWIVVAPPRAELDLLSHESVDSFLERFQQPISGLVLNAGINHPECIENMAMQQWEAVQQVNLGSALQLVRAIAPRMAKQGGGHIVGISSLYAQHARNGRAAYSVSKAGLEALLRTIAIEYADKGILANCVAPGFIDTELTRRNNAPEIIQEMLKRVPLGHLGTARDVANLVRFLLSSENQYITGQTVCVDGGFTIA